MPLDLPGVRGAAAPPAGRGGKGAGLRGARRGCAEGSAGSGAVSPQEPWVKRLAAHTLPRAQPGRAGALSAASWALLESPPAGASHPRTVRAAQAAPRGASVSRGCPAPFPERGKQPARLLASTL